MQPLEWVDALTKKLDARAPSVRGWNDYYDGNQNLQFATEKFRVAFGGLFSEFSDNWCATVVNAVDERLAVTGFRFGKDTDADEDAWRIWQANHMDAESKMGFNASLIDSTGYMMVWPDEREPSTPVITVESAQQVIVAYEPGSRYRRAAALKRFCDEWTDEVWATLYLPDGVYKFKQNVKPREMSPIILPYGAKPPPEWVPRRVDGEDWPLKNPFKVVPIVEMPNRPRLMSPGVSEIAGVVPLQDAVNKLVSDMMVASEFGAFRQKWATGISIPVDPVTNQPVDMSFKAAIERFFVAPPGEFGDTQPQMGEFGQTDLSNFTNAIDMIVSHIASQSRTPPHYLSTSADRLSGESIKSAETGLVSKARDKQLYFGEACEEVMRLCFAVMSDARADFVGAEVLWKDPETRSEAELVDAVQKKKDIGIPFEQLLIDLGYSPTERAQIMAMKAKEELFGPMPDESPQDPEVPPAIAA